MKKTPRTKMASDYFAWKSRYLLEKIQAKARMVAVLDEAIRKAEARQ